MEFLQKIKPRNNFLGFLLLKIKLNSNKETKISKKFLKRYKKLNKENYKISNIINSIKKEN